MSVFPRRVFVLLLLYGYLKTLLCSPWACRIYKVTVHITVSMGVKTGFVLKN